MCGEPESSRLMRRAKAALADGEEITPRLRVELERWLDDCEKRKRDKAALAQNQPLSVEERLRRLEQKLG